MKTMPLRTPLSLIFSAVLLVACASQEGLHTEGRALDAASLQGTTFTANLSPAAWPTTDWWNRLGDPQLNALIEEARARPSTEDRLTELYSAITAASDLLAETITDADTTLRSMQGMQQQLQADIQELKRGMRAG